MVNRWHMLSKTIPVSQLLSTLLKETEVLSINFAGRCTISKDELALGRIENVVELKKVAEDFEKTADEPDLDSFLTRISLVSDLDAVREEKMPSH